MLKYFLLTIIFTYNAMAVSELKFQTQDHFIEVPETRELRAGELQWSHYIVDSCEQYNTLVTNEDNIRETGLRRCKDNSVSFVQPPSRGLNGWEGKCGQTFASNAFYTMCKVAVSPAKYFDGVLRDFTPGVRPGTLRTGMARTFKKNANHCPTAQGRWSYFTLGNTKNYIKRVKEWLIPNYSHPNLLAINRFGKSYFRNPVAALIQNPGGNYIHWVNIIDILESENTCKFIVNHWDNQYEVPCTKIAEWAKKVGKTYPIILKSYSVVKFN